MWMLSKFTQSIKAKLRRISSIISIFSQLLYILSIIRVYLVYLAHNRLGLAGGVAYRRKGSDNKHYVSQMAVRTGGACVCSQAGCGSAPPRRKVPPSPVVYSYESTNTTLPQIAFS